MPSSLYEIFACSSRWPSSLIRYLQTRIHIFHRNLVVVYSICDQQLLSYFCKYKQKLFQDLFFSLSFSLNLSLSLLNFSYSFCFVCLIKLKTKNFIIDNATSFQWADDWTVITNKGFLEWNKVLRRWRLFLSITLHVFFSLQLFAK